PARLAVPRDGCAARETRVQEQPQVCFVLKKIDGVNRRGRGGRRGCGLSVGPRRPPRPLRLACAAALSIALVGVGYAQRRGGPPDGAPAPVQKPYLPVPTTIVVKNPDQYVGENVTMTAVVGKILSKSAFTIDQRVKSAPAGADVL